MANICMFAMKVQGAHENIRRFYDALTQATDEAWIGGGASASIEWDDEHHAAFLTGSCKVSVNHSLISVATALETQRTTGIGEYCWCDGTQNVKHFPTLYEACQEYHINAEVFSWESECSLSEHHKYENGEITEEFRTDYQEYVDEDTFELVQEGGFEAEFDLADVV